MTPSMTFQATVTQSSWTARDRDPPAVAGRVAVVNGYPLLNRGPVRHGERRRSRDREARLRFLHVLEAVFEYVPDV